MFYTKYGAIFHGNSLGSNHYQNLGLATHVCINQLNPQSYLLYNGTKDCTDYSSTILGKVVKYPPIMGKQLRLMMSPFCSRRDVTGLCAPSEFIPVWNHVQAAIHKKVKRSYIFILESNVLITEENIPAHDFTPIFEILNGYE